MKKQFLVLLIGLSLFIPQVSGALPLIRTTGSLRVYKTGSNVRIRITRRAAVIFVNEKCTPSRYLKWTVYQKDVYGRYLIHRTGITGINYKLKIWWRWGIPWGVRWVGHKDLYFSGLSGDYKIKVWFASNCRYQSLFLSKVFSVA